ncbi:ABC transporter ATP-binding protein [Candidatus Bipolaricaulota bacterium]|nr:ABC transporter ATP-binding protein [Candidatus Bipolaricaulota bacterium]
MTNILEVKDLCVEVDGQKLLHGIDLTIPDGEIHALLGPNGCGKTTLMMVVMGYPEYRVIQGQILFNGEDITELDITERARLGIGISQQRPPTIAGVKLQQVLDFIIAQAPKRVDEIDGLVRAVHMERFLDRDVNADLSGGEIKRSELLQLLVTQPRFAMLDEPDSGVDLEALSLVGNMANALLAKEPGQSEHRKSGLIITHTGQILDCVHADKAHIMLNGQIGCSGPSRILLDKIRKYGYEECIRCILRRREE